MRTTALRLFTVLFLLAAILPAETVIKRYDGPLPEREQPDPQTQADLPTPLTHLIPQQRIDSAAAVFILPAFKIDSTSPAGETTALGIRNEADEANTVTLQLYAPNDSDNPVLVSNALLPKEVWTVNLRSETGSLPADFGGTIRGWAFIIGDFLPISVDLFQIDSANDFATGSRPLAFTSDEFCNTMVLRFLVGGAFTGGTVLTFLVDQPQGGDSMNDPPTITGTVYREDGSEDTTFEIFTDSFTLEVDAANLIGGDNFGSMDINMPNGSGGYVLARYKADNRYSVSIPSACLDVLAP